MKRWPTEPVAPRTPVDGSVLMLNTYVDVGMERKVVRNRDGGGVLRGDLPHFLVGNWEAIVGVC